jgi:hypothetical protein
MGRYGIKSRAYATGEDGTFLNAFPANVRPGTVFLALSEPMREDGTDGDTAATYLSPEDAIRIGTELIALGAQLRDLPRPRPIEDTDEGRTGAPEDGPFHA